MRTPSSAMENVLFQKGSCGLSVIQTRWYDVSDNRLIPEIHHGGTENALLCFEVRVSLRVITPCPHGPATYATRELRPKRYSELSVLRASVVSFQPTSLNHTESQSYPAGLDGFSIRLDIGSMGVTHSRLLAVLVGAVLLPMIASVLWVPESTPPVASSEVIGFLWDRDEVFSQLETRFVERRAQGCPPQTRDPLMSLRRAVVRIEEDSSLAVGDSRWNQLLDEMFEAASWAAACPSWASNYVALATSIRPLVKRLSRGWDIEDQQVRRRLYTLLYGLRAAVEEVLSQMPAGQRPTLFVEEQEGSDTPAVMVHGVEVHSGDILLSRGNAPTSAFIARSNDLPGNFSHVAVVLIEDGEAKTVEAHIEAGSRVAGIDAYFADEKLRIMLLRPRRDVLRGLNAGSSAPHLAAVEVGGRVRQTHVPYDFDMDVGSDATMFCSEVASSAYRQQGLRLWAGATRVSSPGRRRWLSNLGVKSFETHGPSDLEYDPNLVVVAEWRSEQGLGEDRRANAVMDVMLEEAEAGRSLGYSWKHLGLARGAKAYSVVLNILGRVGPIPEGMSATAGLRVSSLTAEHAARVKSLALCEENFRNARGYSAPYWRLVELARECR